MPLRLLAPRYWSTWLGLGLLRLCVPLPYDVLMSMGKGLGFVLRILPTRFAHIARCNIRLCLPELTADQQRKVLKDHFASLGMGLFETALSWWGSPKRCLQLTDIDGLEHLRVALSKGKGAILLC